MRRARISAGPGTYFRYPGVRSDTEMHTLGFSFRPWTDENSVASGASILDYVRETAEDEGIAGKIRYGHRVVAVSWSLGDGALDRRGRAHRHR